MARFVALISAAAVASRPIDAASSTPDPADVERALRRTPGPEFRGHDFASMSSALNGHLRRLSPNFRPCESFAYEELVGVGAAVVRSRDEALAALYAPGDGRAPRFGDAAAFEAHAAGLAPATADDRAALRDGLCHEVAMWLAHHVSAAARRELLETLALPLLPEAEPRGAPSAAARRERDAQVSCQQCHTGEIRAAWANATLPPPLPAYGPDPGRERLRSCDYQNDPPCGPCDGLGGRRDGDGVDGFAPMPCDVVGVSAAPVVARYPRAATAALAGDTRSPVAAIPKPGGTYENLSATLMLGWERDDSVMRYRYNFSSAAQIYLQTAAMRDAGDAGAMVTVSERKCVCIPAIAGVMHLDAFAPLDPYDARRDLPGDAGGLAYLGRVNVSLDDGSGRRAVADHYMKWAFHFLVDADEKSPSYGLPLRLYGPYGVRQVFRDWAVSDDVDYGLFEVPRHCLLDGPACRYFANRSRVE